MDLKNKIKKACFQCRKKKTKCGGEMPTCSLCAQTNQDCQYSIEDKKRGPSKGYVKKLEDKIDHLCSIMEDYIAENKNKERSFSSVKAERSIILHIL